MRGDGSEARELARTGGGDPYTHLTKSAFQPIEAILRKIGRNDRLSEICINGPHDVWVRIVGKGYERLSRREAEFASTENIFDLCKLMAANIGIAFSRDMPILACRTPGGGHRFHAVIGRNVESGISVAIRVKRKKRSSWDDFEVDPRDREMIVGAVTGGRTVLVSGGTASGKTTFQNMIAQFIPRTDRVITIEDTRELDLPDHANQVNFVVSRIEAGTGLGWIEVMDSIVRLNPDVVLPGELSIRNAFPVLQAMDTGHDSVITTMHANTPRDAIRGFRRRVALGGAGETEVRGVEEFLADTVALVVQIRHLRHDDNRERRVVTDVVRAKDLVARRRDPDDDARLPVPLGPEDETLLAARQRGLVDGPTLASGALAGVAPAPPGAPASG